jgi:hypothetical protein
MAYEKDLKTSLHQEIIRLGLMQQAKIKLGKEQAKKKEKKILEDF